MTQGHPVVERYVSVLETSLHECDPADRQEIVQEIRNHIAEATAAGKPLAVVLESLGSAEALARAYSVELVLHTQTSRLVDRTRRFLGVAALVAVGSVTTLLVVGALGLIGVAFIASGLAISFIGLVEAAGIHIPGVQLAGIPPGWVVLMGPVLVAGGVICLVGLRFYVRFLARILRNALPQRRTASGAA